MRLLANIVTQGHNM